MAGKELVLYDPEKLKRDQAKVERKFWDKLRKYVRQVPFVGDLIAAYYCAIDPATPLHVKAVLFGALAYFIMPIDLVPDFIAWIGFTDDAAVLYAALRTIAPHIKDSHRQQAKVAIDRLAGDASVSHTV
ncbi:MAG TPA: YkvA family protein [Candidatus Acidoferrum sp.]|nr:YkvA family protein [Candidatus Acidoferrum sp.]